MLLVAIIQLAVVQATHTKRCMRPAQAQVASQQLSCRLQYVAAGLKFRTLTLTTTTGTVRALVASAEAAASGSGAAAKKATAAAAAESTARRAGAKPTLLKLLLGKEMRQEASVALQCIRYIVDTNFLHQLQTASSSSSGGASQVAEAAAEAVNAQ
jgi:hypothetical protein